MDAFIPVVTDEDIVRILRRDFPSERYAELKALIDAVQAHEMRRVVAACMKVAGGDCDRLLRQLEDAGGYWREIISEAEYPKIKKARHLSAHEIAAKREAQYVEWFNRPASGAI